MGQTYSRVLQLLILDIYGCKDTLACNYDEYVTQDNGTCIYPNNYYNCEQICINDIDNDEICDELEVEGCTDINACNYSTLATDEDGSCEYAEEFYDCDNVCLNDNDNDGICNELEVNGRVDPIAANFNENATENDESCIYYPNCQNLIFPSGWSMFSTYIITDEMNIVNVLDPILENVLACKNNNGDIYLPQYSFNGIGDLLIGQGYQIKNKCHIRI